MSNQKPRTIEEQIRLLRSRGMQFNNEEYAKECLAHISYFRLKYYWTDMIDEETEHDFHEGASFDDIKAKILSLLDNHKDIPYGKLGFTGNWRNEPIWK